jgi:Tol biopolymer transport system component
MSQAQSTELVSRANGPAGAQGNSRSVGPSISGDGRLVAFGSRATNLVAGGTNGLQVFVRDRQAGTTELVSADSNGAHGNNDSLDEISISADGRYVAFCSDATVPVHGSDSVSAGIGAFRSAAM